MSTDHSNVNAEQYGLLDVRNFVLLLLVCLHLVDLVLRLGLDVRSVITSVVNELLFRSEIHDVRTNVVHEVRRV